MNCKKSFRRSKIIKSSERKMWKSEMEEKTLPCLPFVQLFQLCIQLLVKFLILSYVVVLLLVHRLSELVISALQKCINLLLLLIQPERETGRLGYFLPFAFSCSPPHIPPTVFALCTLCTLLSYLLGTLHGCTASNQYTMSCSCKL